MPRDPRIPKVGAILTRQYKGREIRILVREEGFEYEGILYPSLSKLASFICGQKAINGLAFFHLNKSSVY
jgi:hypothetical protein